jgi:hypothetical protein
MTSIQSWLAPDTDALPPSKVFYSKAIPSETWNVHRDVILSKYAEMTLKELKKWMETEHNFFATLDLLT